MMKTALFAAAAALATVATAAPAFAKDVVVSYADLDLASAKDQKALIGRLHRAAQKACEFDRNDRLHSAAEMACYREARAKATTQMASIVGSARLGG